MSRVLLFVIPIATFFIFSVLAKTAFLLSGTAASVTLTLAGISAWMGGALFSRYCIPQS